MAMKREETKQLVLSLLSQGLVTQRDVDFLERQERSYGKDYTVEEVVRLYLDNEDRFSVKPSQHALFQQTAINAGVAEEMVADIPTPEGQEEERSFWTSEAMERVTGIGPGDMSDVGASISGAFGAVTSDWPSDMGKWFADVFVKNVTTVDQAGYKERTKTPGEIAYDNAARNHIIRMMEADTGEDIRGYVELNYGGDYSKLRGILREDFDMSDADIGILFNDAFEVATVAQAKKENTYEELEALEAEEAALEESEAGTARYKAFEILEKESPGKYMWNKDNMRIYETVTGQVVDGQGYIDAEFDGDPEEFFWDEAKGTAPWLGLGLGETYDPYGTMSGAEVAEENYNYLDEVVKNPHRYGAEATRYLPGAGNFLGAYGHDYDVEYSGEQGVDWKLDNAYARFSGGQDDWSRTYRDITGQAGDIYGTGSFNARPFYEKDDQWSMFAGKSKEWIGEMQDRLVSVGALDADFVRGSWGPAEAAAMEPWLDTANGQARRWEDVDLDTVKTMYSDRAAATRPTRPAFTAPAYRNMDPATMEQSVQSVMRQMLGRDATSNEIADLGGFLSDQHRGAFVADVQAARQEYDAQGRAIDGGEQSGGEVQDVDFEARFVQQFETKHNAELERMQRTEQSSERQSLIGNQLNNLVGRLGGGF